ncbi:MAG TPA: hypothetical protein VFE47_06115 [Tepidisphaeraceae bacterium]|jgi:hypothetical protein|nr:hypothetical protein [Tepidisphaeraceae bacterium]
MPNAFTVSCGQCGKQHELSLEYVAENGGMKPACSGCGGEMTIPALPPPGATSGPGAPPPRVTSRAFNEQYRAPTPTAPVETPSASIWRDGPYVVAYRNSELPGQCPRCGRAGEIEPFDLRLKWTPGIYTGIRELSMIVNAVMAKEIYLKVHFCRKHQLRYTRGRRAMVLLPVIGVLLFVVMIFLVLYMPTARGFLEAFIASLSIFGFAGIVAGLLCGYFTGRKPRAVHIDEQFVWIGGCSRAFMESFPDISENASIGTDKSKHRG